MTPITLPVAGFRAESVLDQDRMATVWLAADERGRGAVLTIWHRTLVDETERSGYVDWAAALTRTASAHGVVNVLASGLTDDGRPYLAVETGPGTLADRLAGGALTPPAARTCGIDLAEALAVVHAAGIVHGAVRPSTVLATDDRATLSGFGISAPGVSQPLPADAYTPPEHLGAALEGRAVASPAGDVYDLGLTLHFALGGRPTWTEEPTSATLRSRPLPATPGMSPAFLALLRSATAVEPEARPTAAAFAQMLAALDPGEVTTPAPTVDLADVLVSYLRRVAAGTLDAAAGAFGGAAGTVLASRVFSPPTATGPAPVAGPPPPPVPPQAPPVSSAVPGPAGHASTGGVGPGGAGLSVGVKTVVVLVTVAATVTTGGYLLTQRDSGEGDRSTVSSGDTQATENGLVLEPARVDFGTVSLGGETTAIVTLTNRGTEAVTPDIAAVSGEGFAVVGDTCAGQVVAPAATCALTIALHPTSITTYGGELTVPTDHGAVKVPLAGAGEAADLAGNYKMTVISVDPPAQPSDYPEGDFWFLVNDAVNLFATRTLLAIEAPPDCSSAPCPYVVTFGMTYLLDPVGDGTFQGTDADGSITWTVRPDAVDSGRVASLTFTIVSTYEGFTVTHTLTGTRTA
jgi:hypothetical protein